MIPRVKNWNVRMVDGTIIPVRAPNKCLAILNLRHMGLWGSIAAIAVERKKS